MKILPPSPRRLRNLHYFHAHACNCMLEKRGPLSAPHFTVSVRADLSLNAALVYVMNANAGCFSGWMQEWPLLGRFGWQRNDMCLLCPTINLVFGFLDFSFDVKASSFLKSVRTHFSMTTIQYLRFLLCGERNCALSLAT